MIMFLIVFIVCLIRQKRNPVIYADIKSPFTGGKVTIETEEECVKYRGIDFKIDRQFYKCVDTGKRFTDDSLDSDVMWKLFRAYWELKGFEHFYEIDGYDKTDEFKRELLIEYAKTHFCDLIPYNDPDYEKKLLEMCESYADMEMNGMDPELLKICEMHDKMLESGEIENEELPF